MANSLGTFILKAAFKRLPITITLFPKDKLLTLSNGKGLQTRILNLMKMAESSLKG